MMHSNQSLQRLGIAYLLLTSTIGCGGQSASHRPKTATRDETATSKTDASSTGPSSMNFKLTSKSFNAGAAIPRKYTGEGEDVSPSLAWEGAPDETKEFALICDDPDAPTPEPWVHWVIYGIRPDVHGFPEGVRNAPELKEPIAARQGMNTGDTIGYRGPMPPPGHGVHHYHFKLYALDKRLDLPAGATKQQLLDAMKGHVLAEAELVGTYER